METVDAVTLARAALALETFLVEWKLASVGRSSVRTGPLETFLVEWKHEIVKRANGGGTTLKPS